MGRKEERRNKEKRSNERRWFCFCSTCNIEYILIYVCLNILVLNVKVKGMKYPHTLYLTPFTFNYFVILKQTEGLPSHKLLENNRLLSIIKLFETNKA